MLRLRGRAISRAALVLLLFVGMLPVAQIVTQQTAEAFIYKCETAGQIWSTSQGTGPGSCVNNTHNCNVNSQVWYYGVTNEIETEASWQCADASYVTPVCPAGQVFYLDTYTCKATGNSGIRECATDYKGYMPGADEQAHPGTGACVAPRPNNVAPAGSSQSSQQPPADTSQCDNSNGNVSSNPAANRECASAYCTGNNQTCVDQEVTSPTCADATCNLLVNFLQPFVNLLAAAVAVVCVISIVIGGIQYSMSSGDAQKVTAAKERIRNAVIALVAFAVMYGLLDFLIPGGLF